MIKKFVTPITVLLFALTMVFPAAAGAKQADDSLPQTDGTYSVPGHANLKLRVIVHNAKNHSKPGPAPTPTLNCTVTDPQSSTVDGKTGWYLPSSVTYRVNTNSAPGLIGSVNMSTLVGRAFNTWATTTDVGSRFVNGGTTSVTSSRLDNQNVISWGRTSGSALAVTYTWYYTSNHQVAEVDTIFNSNFAWEWSSQSNCAYQGYYDAQDILTHELGHWMGLDDNYDASYTNNTMYGYGSPTEVKKNTLTTGDISAVNTIY